MVKQLLIFTDLDASLLDHYTYKFDAAQEALNLIRQKKIPLILTSSKTFAEMKGIQNRLKIQHPLIFENGSAIAYPRFYFKNIEDAITLDGYEAVFLSQPIHIILELLNSIKNIYGYKFKGFNEMSVQEIARLTGLSETGAELAKQRMCSEPIIWMDNEQNFQKFKEILTQHHLKLLKGGRFYHVIGNTNKGKAVEYCLKLYRKKFPGRHFVTIGIGDSPNDLDFLSVVDHPVLVKKPEGDYTRTPFDDRVIHAPEAGPKGWNMAVIALIRQLMEEANE